MSDPLPPPPPSAPPPSSLKRPSRAPLVVVGVGLLVALGIVGVSWWKGRQAPPPAVSEAPAAPTPEAPPDGAVTPPTAESDTRVRELVGLLSPLPELQKWLASTEDLARRFSSAVASIAEGQSPRASLSFMAPAGRFQVTQREGRLYMAPEGPLRYDTVARVIASLDTATSVITYQALRPLIQGAYQEISRPGQRFEQTLSDAIQHLLDTPVPEGDVEVVDLPGVNYAYASPELERLSAAQKHLVRMGPGNARLVQTKLRELHGALGLPPAAPRIADPTLPR